MAETKQDSIVKAVRKAADYCANERSAPTNGSR
jgi:hypothetical protein